MDMFCLTLMVIAGNYDKVGKRVECNLHGIKIDLLTKVLVFAVTFVISFLAALFGKLIASALSHNAALTISTILLCMAGFLFIILPYKHSERKYYEYNKNKSVRLWNIILSPGIIPTSFCAGIMGMHPVIIGLYSSVAAYLFFGSGNVIIEVLDRLNVGHGITAIAGFVLSAIGLEQII